MKKKRILLVSLSIILVIGIICLYINEYEKYQYKNISNESDTNTDTKVYNTGISYMLETGEGTGEYQESSSSDWPSIDEYTFNSTLSKCENGGRLSWDSESGGVKAKLTGSDKCYAYFDKYIKAEITNVETSNTINTITVSVSATEGDTSISKYLYSINDGTYQESTSNSYTFSGLSSGTTYTIKVKTIDSNSVESDEYSVSVTTSSSVTFTINTTNYTITSDMTLQEFWEENGESICGSCGEEMASGSSFGVYCEVFPVLSISNLNQKYSVVELATSICSSSIDGYYFRCDDSNPIADGEVMVFGELSSVCP